MVTTTYSNYSTDATTCDYGTWTSTWTNVFSYVTHIADDLFYFNGKVFKTLKEMTQYKNKVKSLEIIKLLSRIDLIISDLIPRLSFSYRWKVLTPIPYWQKRRDRINANI